MGIEEAQVLDTGLLPWSKFSLIFSLTDVKFDLALMLMGTDPPTSSEELMYKPECQLTNYKEG